MSYILLIYLHLSIFRDFLLPLFEFLKKSVISVKKDSKVEQLILISCVLVNFNGTYGNPLKWTGAQMYQNLGFLYYQNEF